MNRYWGYTLWLALFTSLYNLLEGSISICIRISDEALTLFGFGADSFMEVISGIGITDDSCEACRTKRFE